ncbi:hypothetical protein [Embleya hyalina]|uniref:Calcineurin-like phosphoesterase domain-containing protein n=1 Tax=Embleya hyalina TaxID=516124 RepID=A0A401YZ32_9ACTN|nr:hypothetical protein [Embleya hyalina]GCD99843.1 hypothetical protein EHYA_07565 [Embleya hyalina]
MTDRTIVVIPDIQYPKHDPIALKAVIDFIGDIEPTEVIQIGDALDYEAPSRWSTGTRAEYEGNVESESESFVQEFIVPLRGVFSGPLGFHEGNHDSRPRTYLEGRAPGLGASQHFHMERLLRFDDYDIRRLPDFNRVGPNVITTHGHLGRITLNRTAGLTALTAVRRWGVSVVMGHTHRAAAVPETSGLGEPRTVWGVEAGNLMDDSRADYLKGAPGNWQRAFVVLHLSGETFQPEVVYMRPDASFEYGGFRYYQPEAA